MRLSWARTSPSRYGSSFGLVHVSINGDGQIDLLCGQ